MSRKSRFILPTSPIKGLLFFFFCIGVSLSSCKDNLQTIKETIDRSALNTERADSVTILYSRDGNTVAKLFTKKFNHIQDVKPTYIEMKKGLRVEFYNDSLQIINTLHANYGKYFEENGNVLVRDSVVVYNVKKEQLNTEELIWNEKLQKFYTDKFVKISTPTQIIYGDGLESNQHFTEYTILHVKGIIGVTDKAIDLGN